MERIGIGNTAEVFAYGKDKVCKLFYKDFPYFIVEREYNNSKLINDLQIPSPKAESLMEQDGRYGIIYERLYGENLLNLLLTQPNTMELLKRMVKIQKQIIDKHSSECLNYKDFLHQLAYGKDIDERIANIIDKLPDGDYVCHGDFHPGNVWISEDGNYKVIDFMNVCHGPREYDIARTYVLLTDNGLPAGISEEQKEQIMQMKYLLGREYLKLMGVKEEQLQMYIEVITAYRKYEME